MKTTFYIIVTFLGLQSSLLFANGSSAQTMNAGLLSYISIETPGPAVEASAISLSDLKVLAPVCPVEADFSDNDLIVVNIATSSTLAPVTPVEADFNDSDADNLTLLLQDLAPVTPVEADFPDIDISNSGDNRVLAPVNPTEATFEDLL
ncbi:MAG: hypothetical protein NTW31_02765 [Bacteroidetes bacterium]|nr:hypothetical protein [Bacteroidota bacterium]